jgi:cytochrome bd-type quinol oxidase subunit 2
MGFLLVSGLLLGAMLTLVMLASQAACRAFRARRHAAGVEATAAVLLFTGAPSVDSGAHEEHLP